MTVILDTSLMVLMPGYLPLGKPPQLKTVIAKGNVD
jgi:hypothetical protein